MFKGKKKIPIKFLCEKQKQKRGHDKAFNTLRKHQLFLYSIYKDICAPNSTQHTNPVAYFNPNFCADNMHFFISSSL